MATVHQTDSLLNLNGYPDELPPEITDYEPTPEDREWLDACDLDSWVPRDLPLAAWVAQQARQHRIRDDEPRHVWIAEQLDKLAQLVEWTGATTPEEHDDRMETYERELRERCR